MRTSSWSGVFCQAGVLGNEALEYRHSSGLTWSGSTKAKTGTSAITRHGHCRGIVLLRQVGVQLCFPVQRSSEKEANYAHGAL